jgi:diguanylate cyclase
MTDKVDWRAKYKSLARETEQHEQQYVRAVEQLRSLAVQFDLAVHGHSDQFDQLTARLVAALQTGKLDSVPELLRKTEQHVRQLDEKRLHVSTIPPAAEDDLSQPHEMYSRRLAERLLQLIQLFNVPLQHRDKAYQLIKRLESGPDVSELERCIEEIATLAQVSGSSTETDIQEYLVGLNRQLEYLRSFLEKSEQAEAKQLRRNNLLDQTVRHDVKRISHTVQQSDNIDELKLAVNTQLASLIKAVNAHKTTEDQHIAVLKQERQQLLTRLDEMEHKAEQFRKSAEEAHMKSRTDPLTGLANRFAYDQQLRNEMERYKRYGTPFSICVADIDFFKRINDEFGHLAGDKVLRLMAKILRSSLRGVDFVARFGGEEFVILMPSTGGESARMAAEKVRKAVEESPFNFQSKPVRITISIGVTEVSSDDTSDTLFSRADSSLYTAKSSGRNCVVKV